MPALTTIAPIKASAPITARFTRLPWRAMLAVDANDALIVSGSSSASTSDAADCGRSAGSIARHFAISFSRPIGTSLRTVESGGGGSVSRAVSISRGLRFANGAAPASIS